QRKQSRVDVLGGHDDLDAPGSDDVHHKHDRDTEKKCVSIGPLPDVDQRSEALFALENIKNGSEQQQAAAEREPPSTRNLHHREAGHTYSVEKRCFRQALIHVGGSRKNAIFLPSSKERDW